MVSLASSTRVYLIEAKRTPIGRSHPDKGIFRNCRADELLAFLMKDFCPRIVPAENLDDIYIGCVGQFREQGKNIARLSSLLAGFPDSVPGTTVNRLCASSLQAFHFAASSIASGHGHLILAGGVEHMQHVPMTAELDYHEGLLSRYEFPFTNMGLTAERLAEKFKISRKSQDEFSWMSHQRALAAQADQMTTEILPMMLGDEVIAVDQGPRADTSLERLAELKPVFKENGTVTAGNSSPLSDGASLTLLASESACETFGLAPRARVVDFQVVGVNPLEMGLGPVPAVKQLLERNRLGVLNIDLFELNEAFAAQALVCRNELGIPSDRMNVSGGAIALGHPLGCTGTRLVTTLVRNLERSKKRIGIASLCIGHGQGMATLLERVS